ncbi:unnamed protein product, partial [Amoebophrya sp. A120]
VSNPLPLRTCSRALAGGFAVFVVRPLFPSLGGAVIPLLCIFLGHDYKFVGCSDYGCITDRPSAAGFSRTRGAWIPCGDSVAVQEQENAPRRELEAPGSYPLGICNGEV